MIILALFWFAVIPKGNEVFTAARWAIDQEYYRTASVLAQEIAYRGNNTPQMTAMFENLADRLPKRITQPVYTLGYQWPHLVHCSEVEQRLSARQSPATQENVSPFDWGITQLTTVCPEVLQQQRFGRFLDPTTLNPTESSQAIATNVGVAAVSAAAELLLSKRLVAALLLDTCDRRRGDVFREITKVGVCDALLKEPLPAATDTNFMPLWAYCVMKDNTANSLELTFRDLLDRTAVICDEQMASLSADRRVVIAKLERKFGDGYFEGIPISEVLTFVCAQCFIDDSINLNNLPENIGSHQLPVTITWGNYTPCRVVLQKALLSAFGTSAKLVVGDGGKLAVQPLELTTGSDKEPDLRPSRHEERP